MSLRRTGLSLGMGIAMISRAQQTMGAPNMWEGEQTGRQMDQHGIMEPYLG
jgi:hypothetical protein